jgi:predicted alpha/beta hydrolase family esterase
VLASVGVNETNPGSIPWPPSKKYSALGLYMSAAALYQWRMRVADVDLILIPGWLAGGAQLPDADHWISRWERNLATARWLESAEGAPVDALFSQTTDNRRPIIIVTHGSGVEVLLGAGEALGARPVIGAFVVAPVVRQRAVKHIAPSAMPLAFPCVGIVPENNPGFSITEGRRLIEDMGGHFVAAGHTGAMDHTSGHGPWPEGLMRLGWFLKQIRKEGSRGAAGNDGSARR